MTFLTAFLLFDFYGAAGWSGAGPISHRMSVVSVCLIAPLMLLVSWCLVERHLVRPQLAVSPR
jgi:hypothetical protein